MRYLVFDAYFGGHHLEYCLHLCSLASSHSENEYLFVLNSKMKKQKEFEPYRACANITFRYLPEDEVLKCSQKNLLKSALCQSIIIRREVRENHIEHVWLIMLMLTMPFLPFMLPKGVKITGVLYRIFLYEEEKLSRVRRWLENIRYRILAHNKHMEKVLVLNDQKMTDVLNSRYNTKNFHYLPDPIPNVDMENVKDLRIELGANPGDKVYLHFGGLTDRKGTLEIMKAVELMTEEQLQDKVFVFAGKVYDDIRNEFYHYYETLKSKVRIRIFDKFCSYDFLFSLCYSCDVILLPYQNTTQSSGVLGYAAFFGKPVIGPKGGLLGDLIESFNLGAAMSVPDSFHIAEEVGKSQTSSGYDYSSSHTITKFCNAFDK